MAVFSRLGCALDGQSCAAGPVFISTEPRGESVNVPRPQMIRLSLLLLPGLLSVSVPEPTVSEKALIESSGLDSWMSCGEKVPFKLQGKLWVCSLTLSHASESVLDYFS